MTTLWPWRCMSLWERWDRVLTWLPMPRECMTSTLAASASSLQTTRRMRVVTNSDGHIMGFYNTICIQNALLVTLRSHMHILCRTSHILSHTHTPAGRSGSQVQEATTDVKKTAASQEGGRDTLQWRERLYCHARMRESLDQEEPGGELSSRSGEITELGLRFTRNIVM